MVAAVIWDADLAMHGSFGRVGRRSAPWEALAVAAVLSLSGPGIGRAAPTSESEPFEPEPSEPDPSIRVLHARGDSLFTAGRYTEARQAWREAYDRTPEDAGLVAYRVTLLSLIASATLEEFGAGAEASILDQTLAVLHELSDRQPGLDPELRAVLDDEIARLEALRPTRADPEPTPAVPEQPDPVEAPVAVEPSSPDPLDPGLTPEQPSVDEPAPRRPGVILTAVGASLLAGGLASVVAGSRFRPRAQAQLDQYDDPESHEEDFLDDELVKGRAWMGVGGAVALAGTGLLVGGLVALVRGRKLGHRASAGPRALVGHHARLWGGEWGWR